MQRGFMCEICWSIFKYVNVVKRASQPASHLCIDLNMASIGRKYMLISINIGSNFFYLGWYIFSRINAVYFKMNATYVCCGVWPLKTSGIYVASYLFFSVSFRFNLLLRFYLSRLVGSYNSSCNRRTTRTNRTSKWKKPNADKVLIARVQQIRPNFCYCCYFLSVEFVHRRCTLMHSGCCCCWLFFFLYVQCALHSSCNFSF